MNDSTYSDTETKTCETNNNTAMNIVSDDELFIDDEPLNFLKDWWPEIRTTWPLTKIEFRDTIET